MLATAGAVAAIGVSGASLASAGGDDDLMTFRLRDVTIKETNIDLGKPGFSVGDQILFRDALRSGEKRVGSLYGKCQFLQVTASTVTTHCEVTAVLRNRGQLEIAGVAAFSEHGEGPQTLSVTGGTGAFRGASGDVEVKEVSDGVSILTFRLVKHS